VKAAFVAAAWALIATGAATLSYLIAPLKRGDWAMSWIVASVALGQFWISWLLFRGSKRPLR